MLKLVPKSKKGNGIFVFCNSCKTTVSNSKKCNHKSKWVYKAAFRINGKRLTRVLQSTDINQAIVELASIKSNFEAKKTYQNFQKSNFVTMNDGLEQYIDYIHYKNGYESDIQNTPQHVDDCKRVLSRYFESLSKSGINPANENINSLGVDSIAPFYELIRRKYKITNQFTKNRHTSIMRTFFNYLINSNLYNKANFFKTIKTKKTTLSPESISDQELKNTLDSISYEKGWVNTKKGRRNVYADWLKDAIKLAQFTGLRREELFNIEWNDIGTYKDVDILYVKDLKGSRLAKEAKYKPIGIDEEFSEFLIQFRTKNNEGKILSTKLKASAACDKLSRAFTHFFKVGNPGVKQKYFKQIRKQKITDISSYLGKDTYLASGHSSQIIIDSYYIDRLEAAANYVRLKKDLQKN